MVSLFLEVLTSIVGVAMSLAHFPQAYHMWRRKSSKDVSLVTYTVFLAGAYVWLVYGFAIGSIALIASYVVAVVSTTTAYVLLWMYR